MRPALALYLALYFLTVGAAAVTLWREGLIEHLPRPGTFIAIAAAVAVGLLLAAVSWRGK